MEKTDRKRHDNNDVKELTNAFTNQGEKDAINVLISALKDIRTRMDDADGLPQLETEQEKMKRERAEREEMLKKNPNLTIHPSAA